MDEERRNQRGEEYSKAVDKVRKRSVYGAIAACVLGIGPGFWQKGKIDEIRDNASPIVRKIENNEEFIRNYRGLDDKLPSNIDLNNSSLELVVREIGDRKKALDDAVDQLSMITDTLKKNPEYSNYVSHKKETAIKMAYSTYGPLALGLILSLGYRILAGRKLKKEFADVLKKRSNQFSL